MKYSNGDWKQGGIRIMLNKEHLLGMVQFYQNDPLQFSCEIQKRSVNNGAWLKTSSLIMVIFPPRFVTLGRQRVVLWETIVFTQQMSIPRNSIDRRTKVKTPLLIWRLLSP